MRSAIIGLVDLAIGGCATFGQRDENRSPLTA